MYLRKAALREKESDATQSGRYRSIRLVKAENACEEVVQKASNNSKKRLTCSLYSIDGN